MEKKSASLSPIIGEYYKGEAEKECLYKSCRTCGYWWVDDCEDQKNGVKKGNGLIRLL